VDKVTIWENERCSATYYGERSIERLSQKLISQNKVQA
jgi:hypothetical protein